MVATMILSFVVLMSNALLCGCVPLYGFVDLSPQLSLTAIRPLSFSPSMWVVFVVISCGSSTLR